MKTAIIPAIIFFLAANFSITIAQVSVNTDEQNEMVFLLEEEKVARDVYLEMNKKYDLKVFKNIAEAEQRHLDRIKEMMLSKEISILEKAELDVGGKFKNQELQKLYNELVLKGQESKAEALKVGAWIEERDITDLNLAIANTTNEELIQMYGQLIKASENHLRAFSRNLASEGISYEPQIISDKMYLDIINSDNRNQKACKGSKSCCKSKNKKCNKACKKTQTGK